MQTAGRFAEALEKFQRSQTVLETPATLLHVAECQKALHLWVEASESFRKLALSEAGTSNAASRNAKQSAATELALLAPRAVVVLGAFGWQALLPVLAGAGWAVPRPRPRFGHGVRFTLQGERGPLTLFGCYHVSQQNTFTGRLTPAMLGDVLRAAAGAAGLQDAQ